MYKRGDFGVGSLIIFLAMLLVGAVAAAVLLNTSSSLQQTTLATGEETEQELVTIGRIMEIAGTNGEDGTVENLSVLIKLVPGSNPIKFENAIIQLDTATFTAYYNYKARVNETAYCDIGGTDYTAAQCPDVAQDEGSGTFTSEYTKEIYNHIDGVLSKGETVRLHIAANTTLEGGDYVRVLFTPNYGTADVVETHLPDAFGSQLVDIYP